MILFPAIDLKDGKCVRLEKGLMQKATIFNESPSDQALDFYNQGFRWLHIVDLNGAFEGKSQNVEAVKSIIKAVSGKMKLQLGGGIRNLESIQMWLSAGIDRVILGTIALKNPDIVKQACKQFPGQIVVGIDGKSGKVATEGWAENSEIGVIELAKKFEDVGVAAIIYTDINKDGLMQGADLDGTVALAKSINIPVIASGGVASMDDLRLIKNTESDGVVGVISGRAIYEGKIDVEKAIQIMNDI